MVDMALRRYDRSAAFLQAWAEAGRLPAAHPTLVLIEPTVSHDKLVGHVSIKLARLKEIIKTLGDPVGEQDEAEEDAIHEDASPASENPRRVQRLALADTAAQLAAELEGMLSRWIEAVRADKTKDPELVGNYHAKFRNRAVRVFDDLIAQGLADEAHAAKARRPPDGDAVALLTKQMERAAAQLRLHDPELAEWLRDRIEDVRALIRALREQQDERPFADYFRVESIHESFTATNRTVIQRLFRDAPPWVDYYHENPEWCPDGGPRVDFYEWTVGQLEHIAKQVG
jgi:hypothetical protein